MLQVRQKFLHAAVFSGPIWLAVLLLTPVRSLRLGRRTHVLVGDNAIIGSSSSAGPCSSRKQERTIGAIVFDAAAVLGAIPAAKLISCVGDLAVRCGCRGHHRPRLGYHLPPLVAGTCWALPMLLVGFGSSPPFAR